MMAAADVAVTGVWSAWVREGLIVMEGSGGEGAK